MNSMFSVFPIASGSSHQTLGASGCCVRTISRTKLRPESYCSRTWRHTGFLHSAPSLQTLITSTSQAPGKDRHRHHLLWLRRVRRCSIQCAWSAESHCTLLRPVHSKGCTCRESSCRPTLWEDKHVEALSWDSESSIGRSKTLLPSPSSSAIPLAEPWPCALAFAHTQPDTASHGGPGHPAPTPAAR